MTTENGIYPNAEVRIVDVVQNKGQAEKRFEPNNPLANGEGYVYYPDIDVVAEMADMMSATRSFGNERGSVGKCEKHAARLASFRAGS